jgi:hypothetical protein
MTAEPVAVGDADQVLGFGIAFRDLYRTGGLARIDEAFVGQLRGKVPALAERLLAARSKPENLGRAAEAELLLALGPALEQFIGTLFDIAEALAALAETAEDEGAGFFVYFNSTLKINRLVFSTNLNSTTSDLAILAAIQSPKGADAIAALPGFGAANFQAVAPVPLPAALPLMVAALAGLGLVRGRRRVGRIDERREVQDGGGDASGEDGPKTAQA